MPTDMPSPTSPVESKSLPLARTISPTRTVTATRPGTLENKRFRDISGRFASFFVHQRQYVPCLAGWWRPNQTCRCRSPVLCSS